MMCSEVKIPSLHEMIADAVHYLIVISLAQAGYQNPNRQRTAIAQGARQKTRLIVEFSGDGFDAVPCNGESNGPEHHSEPRKPLPGSSSSGRLSFSGSRFQS